jgi:hypothetical protein
MPPILTAFSEKKAPWRGPATELLKKLNRLTGGTHASQSRDWPRNAVALGLILQRLAPSLAAAGVLVEKDRNPGGNRGRYWEVRRVDTDEGEKTTG